MSVEISNEHNINEDEDEAWLYGENISKHQKKYFFYFLFIFFKFVCELSSDEMDEINEEKIVIIIIKILNMFYKNFKLRLMK